MTISTPESLAPARAPEAAPPWRACVMSALRCWFGGLVLILVMVPMLMFGDTVDLLVAAGGFVLVMLASAVLSTLTALVIESLTARTVPVGGHVGLVALAGTVLVGLLSFDLGFLIVAFVVCLISATIGALIGIGRPTWRRYAIVLGVALLIFFVQASLS